MVLRNNLSDIKCVFMILIIAFHDVVPTLARNSAIQILNRAILKIAFNIQPIYTILKLRKPEF